jgi:hypothetical protein
MTLVTALKGGVNIGDVVTVNAVAQVRKTYDKGTETREIVRRTCKPFQAVITGETHRREGCTNYWYEDGGREFIPSKAKRVILVRVHPRRREIDVFPEDIEVIDD